MGPTSSELVLVCIISHIDDGGTLIWLTVCGKETGSCKVWSKTTQCLFKNG